MQYRQTGSSWGDKRIEAEIWIRRWDYPQVKDYLYYLKYRNYKHRWGKFRSDEDADTYGYAFISANWASGTQPQWRSFSNQNLWANNIHILTLTDIPYNEPVSFDESNYSWFKRDGVEGINMNHPTVVR